MRDSVVFYRSFWEAIEELPAEQFKESVRAIMEYGLNDKEPDTSGIGKAVFILSKPYIDRFYHLQEKQNARRCWEYKAWRKAVFERDNFTCQKCLKQGCELNAHHIKGFSKYQQLRFELSNGITLCYDCHKEVHRSEK